MIIKKINIENKRDRKTYRIHQFFIIIVKRFIFVTIIVTDMVLSENQIAYKKVYLLHQLAWRKDGYILMGSYSYIRIVHYEVTGYYRGEDSGARYPEYDGPFEDALYDLSGHLDDEFGGRLVSDLIKDLLEDKAEWVPMIRHNQLIGYLLEHPEMRVNATEEFIKELQVVNCYYDLNVERNPYNKTITLYRDSEIVAIYDLSKETSGVIGSNGPISYNIISGLTYKHEIASFVKDFDLFKLARDLNIFTHI